MVITNIFSFSHNVFYYVKEIFFSLYPPLQRRGGYTVLTLSVLLSILPSVTIIFRHTFLSNHASQPLQTKVIWLGVLQVIYRIHDHQLYTSCFTNIAWSSANFSSHFSQQSSITATSNFVWCIG